MLPFPPPPRLSLLFLANFGAIDGNNELESKAGQNWQLRGVNRPVGGGGSCCWGGRGISKGPYVGRVTLYNFENLFHLLLRPYAFQPAFVLHKIILLSYIVGFPSSTLQNVLVSCHMF